MSDDDTEGIGCRPLAEAIGIGWGLFVLGVVVLFGSDPATVDMVRRFVFFVGAPATTVFQFFTPEGFSLAWPIDLLAWALSAVWVAKAADRSGWLRRMGLVLGVCVVLAAIAV